MKAVRDKGLRERLWKKLKKTQKTFEKVLDKGETMWYNNRVAKKRETLRGGNRSLKIEQQEISTKQTKSAMKNLDQFIKRILLKQK